MSQFFTHRESAFTGSSTLWRVAKAFIIFLISALLVLSGPLASNISLSSAIFNGTPLSAEKAFADNSNSSQSQNDAQGLLIGENAKPNETVKAGVFAFEGYHMKDDAGNFYGYGIEILDLISKYSHLNFDLIGYSMSWDKMLEMLENGDIDVVTSASKTESRLKKFDYSLPIGRKKTILSIRSDETRFKVGVYSTFNGIVVGELKGNSQNDLFADFANEEGFDYSVKEYDDTSALVQALQDGKVDAILTSNLRKPENEKTLETIEEDNYYAIVRKGDTKLLDEINYAIEQMDRNEGDWQNTLFYKYYGPTYSNELEFTDREKAYIEEVKSGKKTISATAYADRSPYSFSNNGALSGILIDYFSAVMAIADLPYKLVVPESLAQYEKIIRDEEVNVVIDGFTNDSANAVYFADGFSTDVFMDANIVKVTRNDFSGTPKSIAVTDSSTGSLDEFLANLKNVDLTYYPTREAALTAVKDGNADAAYVYVYTAQEFMNRDFSNSLTYSTEYSLDVQFNMRISANTDHELVTILNKCIKQVPESTLNTLATEYTSYSVDEQSMIKHVFTNPWIMGVILALILIVVGIIFMLAYRGRWNKRLLETQEQSNEELQEQLSIVEALSRDYTNVFAIDDEKGTAKIVKLEGYVTEGLHKDSDEEHDYDAILTTYINDRVHPEDREQLLEELSLDNVISKISKDNEYAGTYRILVDDEVHNFQYTYVLVEDLIDAGDDASESEDLDADAESKTKSFVLAGFRNIDEAVRKEQEQKAVLAEALAQAQYANNAKTTFLNNMSHDIRTPMNAIIGFTTLAGTHINNTEQVQGYLSKILTSSNHLLSLINDVLDMSRIESGKVKIDNKETNLPEVMHDLRTIVQADIKAKGLEFYIDMLGVTNEVVICDKLRLSQVLLNILSNAVKYTNPGGMVSVRVEQTATDPNDDSAEYKFIVKDTGIGMSETFLEHVFEPFEREETATVSGIQGTGLGLAITKNIVDMMGGTIEVTSKEDEGSTFTVTFRFDIQQGVEPFVPPEELKDLRALVVDDDVDTCTSVSSMLLTIGMRPDWTTLGEEALAHTNFALEQGDPYKAYIIDWMMPNMSGLELVKRLRRIVGDEAPIIIATAYDWTDIEEEARAAGVTAICSKPLFLSELREVLVRALADESDSEVIIANEGKADEIEDAFERAVEKLSGMHILMAEDNALSREIAVTILEDANIEVDAVEDGKFAVERMKEMPAGTYDVILTDVQMPIMNGYETTRAIRALDDPEKASIPIIAVTANAFDEDREEAEDAGMSGYVPKPIDINNLFDVLEDILGK